MPADSTDGLRSRFMVGVSSTTIASVFPQVVTLVGMMLILRWVDQDHFGIYALLIVLVQLFNTVSELGIGSAIIRNIQAVSGHEERQQMIVSAISTILLLAIVAGALAIAVRPFILQLYDFELLSSLLWYLPLLLVLAAINGITKRILQAVYAYKALLIVSIGNALLRFALVVGLVKGMSLGVSGLIYADLISGVATFVVSVLYLPVRPRLHIDRVVIGRLLAFGFPLYLNGLLSYAFVKVDVLMIGGMTSATYVAAVEVAKRIPTNLSILLSSSFMSVFYPNVSALVTHGQQAKAVRLVNMSSRVMTFGVAVLTVFFIMLQDEIVLFLFSEDYLFVGPAVTMFMLAMTIGVSSNVMGTTLVAGGHTKAPVRVNLLVVFLNIIGNLLLIPRFGFLGAAVATLIAAAVALPLNHIFLKRKMFAVDIWAYTIPLVLALLFWGGRHWLQMDARIVRTAMVLVYPLLCLALMPSLRSDLHAVLRQGRTMLTGARGIPQ